MGVSVGETSKELREESRDDGMMVRVSRGE